MADPADSAPPDQGAAPAPRKRRTGLWVAITFGVLVTIQAGPAVLIIIRDDLAGSFDWAGFAGYTLGSVAMAMVIGCLGLLFKPNRGLGFFLISIAIFLFALFGNISV